VNLFDSSFFEPEISTPSLFDLLNLLSSDKTRQVPNETATAKASNTDTSEQKKEIDIQNKFGELKALEDGSGSFITLSLPKLEPSDLKLDFDASTAVLKLAADKKFVETEETTEFGTQKTVRAYSVRRNISLPKDTDPSQIKADFNDGKLTITVANSQISAPPAAPLIESVHEPTNPPSSTDLLTLEHTSDNHTSAVEGNTVDDGLLQTPAAAETSVSAHMDSNTDNHSASGESNGDATVSDGDEE